MLGTRSFCGPAPPKLPFKTSQIPSNRDHKALTGGTLRGLGGRLFFGSQGFRVRLSHSFFIATPGLQLNGFTAAPLLFGGKYSPHHDYPSLHPPKPPSSTELCSPKEPGCILWRIPHEGAGSPNENPEPCHEAPAASLPKEPNMTKLRNVGT